MKTKHLAPIAFLTLLAGCSDHAKHETGAVPHRASAAKAEATPSPKMSMKATDGRIASLAKKSSDCNIESVNDSLFEPQTPTVAANATANVSGWLIDTATKSVPTNVMVRLESEAGDKAWEQQVSAWGDRGDIVSTHQNVQAYQKSGFQVGLDIGELSPGSYNIYLVYGAAGDQTACGVGRRLVVN